MTITDDRNNDASKSNQKKDKEELNDQPEEELFFDGEHYYTKEEFFNPDDEEEGQTRKPRRGLKITIAAFITVALLSNVFAIWPQLFNFPAMEFIAVSQELSNNEDVQLYKESVVVIRSGNSKGTGFYISENGYIMTNEHVVSDYPQATVSFENGSSYTADVIETDPERDVAILHIETDVSYPVLDFAEEWVSGMSIYVIGNPLFFNFIANQGKVTGTTDIGNTNSSSLVLDAPIYHGSSGSPVIREDGKVVGIVYATTRLEDEGGSTRKVGLAIPTEELLEYQNY
ncbi:trypsin-like peptidase domain-containing protein [Salipaludibacillus agaradhaerens]|uniref:S1 family peptidase n=1 Tax=Salipaludibacillus agaradhaerens TaxID=76935 RepID=UPI0021513C0A|nr:serine protease [Salipaludibacillus agaradhaerens]MCR6106700.1 trypsin-like peptidase domain-containing protein [Salipaludibacillus agaradhaerens]MCR6118733.1 trypsin-like peptidase domain-containing protein [Salipaludibacillus agaradhaerens]